MLRQTSVMQPNFQPPQVKQNALQVGGQVAQGAGTGASILGGILTLLAPLTGAATAVPGAALLGAGAVAGGAGTVANAAGTGLQTEQQNATNRLFKTPQVQRPDTAGRALQGGASIVGGLSDLSKIPQPPPNVSYNPMTGFTAPPTQAPILPAVPVGSAQPSF